MKTTGIISLQWKRESSMHTCTSVRFKSIERVENAFRFITM